MEAPPPTARVRPAKCPGCGVAARPLGARLHVVGHGVRERQVRGPLRAGRPPGLVVVRVRRFRCRVCGAVITVLPRGVAPRRHFGAGAMGLAIAWLADGTPARKIRENVGGIGPPEGGWVTLRRWGHALRLGSLLPGLRPIPIPSRRERAARAVMILSAYAQPSLSRAPPDEQVFAGAVRLARAA